MALTHSPKIPTDGLVLYLDAANPKSFEPNYSCAYRWFSGVPTAMDKTTMDTIFGTYTPEGVGSHFGTIDWSSLGVKPSYINVDVNFAWEVSGYLRIEKTGVYEFATQSDDANELYINGSVVTSFYSGRGFGAYDYSAPILLTRGYTPFIYRMKQAAGGAGARVSWKKPGDTSFSTIPKRNYAGSGALDISPNSGLLELFSDISYVDNSFSFDGLTKYFRLENSVDFHFQTYTYLSWINIADMGSGSDLNQIISKWGSSNAQQINVSLHVRADQKLRALVSKDTQDTTAASVSSALSLSENTWYFVGCSYSSGILQLYINGEPENFVDTGYTGIAPGTNAHFHIGKFDFNWTIYRDEFNGKISSVLGYSRLLSDEEIRLIYNSTKSRFGL